MSNATNLIIFISADEKQSQVLIAGASTHREWKDKMMAVLHDESTKFGFSKDSSITAKTIRDWIKPELYNSMRTIWPEEQCSTLTNWLQLIEESPGLTQKVVPLLTRANRSFFRSGLYKIM